MRYTRTLLLCCCVTLAATAAAQNSILWEVTGNGVTAPSYLMGTLKFIGEKEFFMPVEVNAKMKKCKIFAIEDQVDHHAQHELNKAVHFPEGQSLKTALKVDDYKTVVTFFENQFGMSSTNFERHYGKLIPLALSMTMVRLSLGEGVKFYDIELLKDAKKNKLETYSLEDIDREASALNSYSMDAQVKALLHSVSNFETQKKEFQELMRSYPQGDLDKIFEYTIHPLDNNAEFIDEFYTKRNQEWLPKLDKMMHDKPSFIAVGVTHLEGDNGLLNLLRRKGYTLTPVKVTR